MQPNLDHAKQWYAALSDDALLETSILDRGFFNIGLVADWRTHFEALSDVDFLALDPGVFCAGLEDRVARLRTAYADEKARRGSDK